MAPLPMDLRDIMGIGDSVEICFCLFRKSFCFLVKICVCRNQLGLVGLGYKYQLYGTGKESYTSNTTILYNFHAIYFPVSDFAIFSFRRVLSS